MPRPVAWAVPPTPGGVFAPVQSLARAAADRDENREDLPNRPARARDGRTIGIVFAGSRAPGRSRSGAKTRPNGRSAWSFHAASPRETSPARSRPHRPGCLPGDTRSSRLPGCDTGQFLPNQSLRAPFPRKTYSCLTLLVALRLQDSAKSEKILPDLHEAAAVEGAEKSWEDGFRWKRQEGRVRRRLSHPALLLDFWFTQSVGTRELA